MKNKRRMKKEHERCPHCYGNIELVEPEHGVCGICGKALDRYRYAVK
jgi:rRNA maturation endonuclease Nob1